MKIMKARLNCVEEKEMSSKSNKTHSAMTYATRASFSLSERTWASSVEGPGLNFGEQIAGKSMLGTTQISN